MDTRIAVALVVLVAAAAGWWLARRRPWSRASVFAAVAGWVASVVVLARGAEGVQFYVFALIGASLLSALMIAGLRRT